MYKVFASVLILLFLFFLVDFDLKGSEYSLDDACKADPVFCEKVQADSRCRGERQKMMVSRYEFKLSNEDIDAYHALINTESFVQCADLAKDIEYNTEPKFTAKTLSAEQEDANKAYLDSVHSRKNQKLNNLRYAQAELERLQRITKRRDSPELDYYHWSRFGDNDSIAKLEELDKNGQITASWLQYEMALHYGRYNKEKALHALHKSLSTYPKKQYEPKSKQADNGIRKLDDEGYRHYAIIRSLIHYHFSQEKYGSAYIYARLLDLNNDLTADMAMIIDHMNKPEEIGSKPFLDKQAKLLHKKMKKEQVTVDYLKKMEKEAA